MTLEAYPLLDAGNIYIDFTLLHNGGRLARGEKEVIGDVEFEVGERCRFRLDAIQEGICRYCQGQFTKEYFSEFNFVLFAMISDYRFRPYRRRPGQGTDQKEMSREKVNDITQLFQWSQKWLKIDRLESYCYRKYVRSLRYHSTMLRCMLKEYVKHPNFEAQLLAPLGKEGKLVEVDQKRFAQYANSYEPETVDQASLRKQLYAINQQNFIFLQKIVQNFSRRGFIMPRLQQLHRRALHNKYNGRIKTSLVFGNPPKEPENYNGHIKLLRDNQNHSELQIIDEQLFLKPENQQSLFLDVSLPEYMRTKELEQSNPSIVLSQLSALRKKQPAPAYDQRNLLIVFCHGLQASALDMELLQREMRKILPVSHYLLSQENESLTEGDIGAMGQRLAVEIKRYISKNMEFEQVIINYVGHSMGGIIARASLQHLMEFTEKQFGFYFSLSSPHLGYLNGVNMLVKAGMWLMRTVNKTTSLEQLAMEESGHHKDTFLFKLSKTGNLKKFQKIILLSCPEDGYVSWHSARIAPHRSRNNDSRVEEEMCRNIIGDKIVHRIDVHWQIETTDINSFIGRTAHIDLLVRRAIIKLINVGLDNLYDIRSI